MLSRKDQQSPGKAVPGQWCEKLENVLKENYRNQIQSLGKKIEVYALTYENELFLAASLVESIDTSTSPVTLSLSIDLDEKSEPKDILDNLVNSMAIFFDEYFSTPNWDDYSTIWSEATHEKQKFYYQVTRENIGLTIKANQLLNQ